MKRKLFQSLLMLTVGLMLSVSCSGSNRSSNQQKAEKMNQEKAGKVLVVFFSHAGENYSVGNIKVGNTKLVADEIQRITGADEFEIVAEKSYDLPYDALTKLAKEETEQNEKPAFKGEVKDMSQYQTIFIGGPIWWGTYPQVMFTFFDQYDLNGKTIIPFSTHEGSGLGRVVSDLKALYPQAEFKEAFSIYGHEAQKDLRRVADWLKKLGY